MKADNRNITMCVAIANEGSAALRLTVEPWAEERVVSPGSALEISFAGPNNGRIEFHYNADQVIVYGWEGSVMSIGEGDVEKP